MKHYYSVGMGETLKGWRERKGLSLYRIAKLQNMRIDTLQRIENGEEVTTGALLQYINEVRNQDPEFDIIKTWREQIGFEKKVDENELDKLQK